MPTKRLHSIIPGRDGAPPRAMYDDREGARAGISADEAKQEFLGRCEREIASHKQALAEWERNRVMAESLTESDFVSR